MPNQLLSCIARRLLGRRPSLCCTGIALLLSVGCAGTPSKVSSPTVVANQSGADQAANFDQSRTSKSRNSKDSKKRSPLLAQSFDEAVARGDDAWRAGDVEMAIYLYVQALSFRPRDIDTLSKIGSIEQRQGNLALAARAYELAANAEPSNARVTARLGLIYVEQGDDDSAMTWLQRSAEDDSTDWRVYDGLGVVEQRRGDNPTALRHLQQAVALAPSEPAPLLHRALAMFNAGDYSGAELTVRTALSHGALPEAVTLLGQIQAKQRSYSESLYSLLRVLEAPQAYSTVATMALENGDNAVALRYFEQAEQLSPVYFPEAERNAAVARERLGSANR
jgi:Tfp pilus assembly protein PilF